MRGSCPYCMLKSHLKKMPSQRKANQPRRVSPQLFFLGLWTLVHFFRIQRDRIQEQGRGACTREQRPERNSRYDTSHRVHHPLSCAICVDFTSDFGSWPSPCHHRHPNRNMPVPLHPPYWWLIIFLLDLNTRLNWAVSPGKNFLVIPATYCPHV